MHPRIFQLCTVDLEVVIPHHFDMVKVMNLIVIVHVSGVLFLAYYTYDCSRSHSLHVLYFCVSFLLFYVLVIWSR